MKNREKVGFKQEKTEKRFRWDEDINYPKAYDLFMNKKESDWEGQGRVLKLPEKLSDMLKKEKIL